MVINHINLGRLRLVEITADGKAIVIDDSGCVLSGINLKHTDYENQESMVTVTTYSKEAQPKVIC